MNDGRPGGGTPHRVGRLATEKPAEDAASVEAGPDPDPDGLVR